MMLSRITLLGDEKISKISIAVRFPHHLSHSGYSILTDYLTPDFTKYVFYQNYRPTMKNSIIKKIVGFPGYPSLYRHPFGELSVLQKYKNSIIFHQNLEHTFLFSATEFSQENIHIGTFHLPPQSFLRLTPWYLEKMYKKLLHIIALSPDQRTFLQNRFPEKKVTMIPHGIDTKYFSYNYRPDEENPYIISIGTHGRDYEKLIKFMRSIEPISDLKCIIVTRHNIRSDESNLIIKNNLTDQQLIELYSHAILLYLPLIYATANNTILECLSMGIPIITTDLNDIKYYVGKNNGTFIPIKSSINELYNSIINLYENKTLRMEQSRKLRKQAETFSWTKIGRDIDMLLNQYA